MRRVFLLTGCVILFSACGNKVEKLASEKLELAREAFARDDFAEAKLQLDSIKILYPKAFEARKAGNELQMQVELKEQGQRIDSIDRAMAELQDAFESVRSKYTFEKNEEYQQVGNYVWPAQVLERNLHRSYLRFQVNEQGRMSMTSTYCGQSVVNHHSIKVIAPDDTFAQTPQAHDSYHTTDLGEKIEKADFRLGEDGGVMEFIYAHNNQNIRVEFLGDRSYRTTMLPADREGLVAVYDLYRLLSSMEQLKKAREEAALKIEFIHKRIERNSQEEAE